MIGTTTVSVNGSAVGTPYGCLNGLLPSQYTAGIMKAGIAGCILLPSIATFSQENIKFHLILAGALPQVYNFGVLCDIELYSSSGYHIDRSSESFAVFSVNAIQAAEESTSSTLQTIISSTSSTSSSSTQQASNSTTYVSVTSTPVVTPPFTTMTTILTTTWPYTTNVSSANTLGTTETGLVTNTIVSTVQTVFVPLSTCSFGDWNVTVNPGTVSMTGTIGPPNTMFDFYIMTQQQFLYFNFSSSRSCGNTPYLAEVVAYNVDSTYSLNWQNPPARRYHFIFALDTVAQPYPVTLTVPFTLVATFNQMQTSTIVNLTTNQLIETTTQTVTSVQVTQTPPELLSSSNLELVLGAIVVVLLAYNIMLFRKRK